MNDVLTMMREAAGRTADLVESVTGDELSLPTPCSDYDVKGLINHLEWAMTLFESVGEGGGFPPQKEYTGDFRARAERMLAVWERPETWEGACEAMGGLPKATLARMALTDLVAHGWDLAKATGRDFEASQEAAELLAEFAARQAPTGRKMGAFGPEVKVPDDAPALDRFLGLIGRDPAWKP
ncbi:TIGR03086 family metal-binding protein [Nonomuraea sp. NPDC049309]|uniref:TIGR03086 family metal-binding protein n=1 Tax=Nonomuraea sp. NPDC049309 TaxID=3364350 RepID=UPI0037202305